jgi:aspartate racemase
MKVIGILGGLAPESTKEYYDRIIKTYYERKGDYGYPEIIIYSVNFQKYVNWQNAGDWQAAAEDMIKAIASLKTAGAEFGVIATNTMHKVFDEVQESSEIPLISIMAATADAIKARGFSKVGLLGTIFTMKESFYKDALTNKGIEVILPTDEEMEFVNRVIYDELTIGEFKSESRAHFVDIVKKMNGGGAEGVILGCTEIPLLISEADCGVPLFNTVMIHADAALEFAMRD